VTRVSLERSFPPAELEYKRIYGRSYIRTAEKHMKTSQLYAQLKAVVKSVKPEKNSSLTGIRTHDLCNTGYPFRPDFFSSGFNLS